MDLNDSAPAGWWPVDKVFLVYLSGIGALIAANFARVPDAGWLLAGHALGLALIVAAGGAARPIRAAARVFHYWYPLAYIPLCYKEMALLIPSIRGVDFDAALARLDHRLWGADPVVWLERLQSPWLTEYLQFAYTLFIPCVVLVGVWLWLVGRRFQAHAGFPAGFGGGAARKRRPTGHEFRFYAFVITLGFLGSYLGYFLVPVRGPRFYLAALPHAPLAGVWMFDTLQHLLDHLESAHYDCFPSGHTALTMIACWGSRRISPRVFLGFCLYTASIVFATVYLRYHYTVDVLAGAGLAAVVLLVAPRLYAVILTRRQEETG
jgi:membrane-associated phospholipid phosphatase